MMRERYKPAGLRIDVGGPLHALTNAFIGTKEGNGMKWVKNSWFGVFNIDGLLFGIALYILRTCVLSIFCTEWDMIPLGKHKGRLHWDGR